LNRSAYISAVLLLTSLVTVFAQDKPHQINLPTSKRLTVPAPGRLGSLNSFPVTIALSPDGQYAALLNDGYGTQQAHGHQSISVLNLKTNQVADFPEARLPEDAHQSYFLGLAFGSDSSHLYASMGSITDPEGRREGDIGDGIAVYTFRDGKITPERFIKISPQKLAVGKKVVAGLKKTEPGTAIPYPAGLAVISGEGAGGDKLLVANDLSDNAVLLDSASGRVVKTFDLSTGEHIPTSFPYTVVATRDGRRAWCGLWNASRVAELDLQQGTVTRWIPLLQPADATAPGSHPTALLLDHDEHLLYVALSNADRVAVVSTDTGQIVRLLDTRVEGQNFAGSYPEALALSSDGTRLYAADSAINAVAVFDVSRLNPANATGESVSLKAEGFIPTAWYPSALANVGDDLLIATAKGQGAGPNNFAGQTDSERRSKGNAYIPTLLYGSLARLKTSEVEKNLAAFSRQVEQDNLFRSDPGRIQFAQGSNPIRHVIYILKENRTYDQILGDLKVGNGDPSLTMYGQDVTPNEHKLALQFGVLDNFYDSGEVSGDGHEWSMAAIATDYNEKTWQIGYRSQERTYDYQGSLADDYPLDLGEPDVDAPSTGYIWDNVASHELSYRIYGEFVNAVWCKPERAASPMEGTTSPESAACPHTVVNKGERLPQNVGNPHGSASPWPWAVPLFKQVRPNKAVLRNHYDPVFPDFNTEYPDQLRADEFLNEFAGFVRAAKEGKGEELPAFVLLYLPDDHTHGTAPGKPRPAASVADNDLAVGRVAEAVSHSPYWNDTAIFMLEDDAQDGADHVDAHRSIAFVISKYSPGSAAQPFVDSRFYTTVNMIHTIETLLGLPPMNQNDAYAPVMAAPLTGPGTQRPFTADWSNRDNGLIYQMNPPKGQGAKASAEMNFTRPDAVNTAVLNRILWHDRKGATPMPAPKHTVFPAKAKDDD